MVVITHDCIVKLGYVSNMHILYAYSMGAVFFEDPLKLSSLFTTESLLGQADINSLTSFHTFD
jgi:hypothetical protein